MKRRSDSQKPNRNQTNESMMARRLSGRWPWITEDRLQTVCIVAGVLIAMIGSAFAALSYFAIPADRPELEPFAAGIFFGQRVAGPVAPAEWFVSINWVSLGNRRARCGFVTVYAADENGARQSKLGADLIGPGKCEPVTFSTSTVPLAVSDFPDHLLICASSRNESGKKYRQAFRYRVLPPEQRAGPPPSRSASLEELLPRPSDKASKTLCR
jgi:hypothetical protein